MTFGVIVVVLAMLVGIVLAVGKARGDAQHRREGAHLFGVCILKDGLIRVGEDEYPVTRETHAEVIGGVSEGRRSTATRTAAGAVVGGVPGALVGHAAKKKTRRSNAVLAINGADWTETVPVGPTSYAEAVRFAQQINLAARRSAP